jgi:hypothetical protein
MRRRPGPTAPRRIAWERLEGRTLLSNLPLDGPTTNAVEPANGVVQSAFTTPDSNLFSILGAGLTLGRGKRDERGKRDAARFSSRRGKKDAVRRAKV